MNCCWILILILLCCNGNKGDCREEMECGNVRPEPPFPCMQPRPDPPCSGMSPRQEQRPYSQYEPRTCGCEEQS